MNREWIDNMNRRNFIKISALVGTGFCLTPEGFTGNADDVLKPTAMLKGLKEEASVAVVEGSVGYAATEIGDGLLYTFPAGTLVNVNYLSSDILVDGTHLAVFLMQLREGEDGPAFGLRYKGLNQAQARIQFPLRSVDQNRWLLDRDGAWLKPTCEGERVDLQKVDRMTITVIYKSDQPVQWCQSPFYLLKEKPARIEKPLLPKGKLLDEMGQSTIHEWPTKTRNPEELASSLKKQLAESDRKKWPDSYSRWGGWKEPKREGTGFFATHHDGKRWWLVDPDGCLYWSVGLDCVESSIYAYCGGLESALTWIPSGGDYEKVVQPRAINYLGANLIRAFGKDAWHAIWSKITLSQLRDFGFNTVANWSEWNIAREAQFPYVRPLSIPFPHTPNIYRDFPDVFHPNFVRDAERVGDQLKPTRDDPALIGYFLMNEPIWGFSSESPAAGMLFNSPDCESRKELALFLQKRYTDNPALVNAWKIETTFDAIATGEWKIRLTEEAKNDLLDFSEKMVERFFQVLSESCKAADPHHLNLGIRYQGIPPKWAIPGMKYFDVFSANCYDERVPRDVSLKISEQLNMPVMIGEFHFGALDAGLPSPGLVHVRSQMDRGRAYRYYVEDALANPYCVGVHYFTLYDESAMGRFDGENYNIGFLDICNRPYQELVDAAKMTHDRLYDVAAGTVKPFEEKPDYLPRLF